MSDSHLGLPNPPAEPVITKISNFVEDSRIVVAGDLILGPKQKEQHPNWQNNFNNDASEFLEMLRRNNAIIIAGNCERQTEMNDLGFGQLPYAYYDEKTGVFVTHGHTAEPRGPQELLRNLFPALASQILGTRKIIEYLLGTNNEAPFDVEGTVSRLQKAVNRDPSLQAILEEMDTERHEASTGLYMTLINTANFIPRFRNGLDSLVRLSLDDYYIRVLIHSVRELIEKNIIPPPTTILYGHTHRAFILNTDQIKRRLGLGKYEGWLPEYIANTGTAVPLSPENCGTGQSHLVRVGKNNFPELIRTDTEPFVIVNRAGFRINERM